MIKDNENLPIKLAVSNCEYFSELGFLKMNGWLIPNKYQANLIFSYNGKDVTNLLQKTIRLDVEKAFPEYKERNSGWSNEVKFYGIDRQKSNELEAEIKIDGKVVHRQKFEIKFIQPSNDQNFINNLLKSNNYICSIGSIEVRKNYNLLYSIWRKLAEEKKETPPLVIIGRRGYLSEEIIHLMTTDPLTKDKIIILSNIENEQKNRLIDNSLFTIYPSFYEGWGLPVAESLSRGKLCIASNQTSVPEIAGDLIPYIDPYDVTSSYKTVLSHIENPHKVIEAEDKIHNFFSTTSWNKTTKEIIEGFEDLL